MPKFVTEREIPGAGAMTDEEIRAAAIKSVQALSAIGPQIQWLHSYVTANKVYCAVELQDGKIRRNSDYWVTATLMKQVGLLPSQ